MRKQQTRSNRREIDSVRIRWPPTQVEANHTRLGCRDKAVNLRRIREGIGYGSVGMADEGKRRPSTGRGNRCVPRRRANASWRENAPFLSPLLFAAAVEFPSARSVLSAARMRMASRRDGSSFLGGPSKGGPYRSGHRAAVGTTFSLA